MASRPKKKALEPTGGTIDSWDGGLVSARVLERMKSAGYNQVTLAKLAGVSQSQISRLCSGKRVDGVSIRTLYGIAPHLDCPIEKLLGLDVAPNRGKPSTIPPPSAEQSLPAKAKRA